MIRGLLGGTTKKLQAQLDALSTVVASSSDNPQVQAALAASVASAQQTAQTAQNAASTAQQAATTAKSAADQALTNTATLTDTVAALNRLSDAYIAAVKVSQDDRTSIHTQLDAIAARVTALEVRKLTITSGAFSSPPLTLLSGATQTITVAFATPMSDTNYAATVNLIGGTAILGAVRIAGITAKTTTGVTAQVAVTGLSGLVGASYTVEAIAVRNG